MTQSTAVTSRAGTRIFSRLPMPELFGVTTTLPIPPDSPDRDDDEIKAANEELKSRLRNERERMRLNEPVLFEKIFMLWCSMPDTFASIQFNSIKSTRK
jgi:hypothetical protein